MNIKKIIYIVIPFIDFFFYRGVYCQESRKHMNRLIEEEKRICFGQLNK